MRRPESVTYKAERSNGARWPLTSCNVGASEVGKTASPSRTRLLTTSPRTASVPIRTGGYPVYPWRTERATRVAYASSTRERRQTVSRRERPLTASGRDPRLTITRGPGRPLHLDARVQRGTALYRAAGLIGGGVGTAGCSWGTLRAKCAQTVGGGSSEERRE